MRSSRRKTADVLPVHGQLRALRDEVMAAVRTGFPRIPRRVSGYNLDQLLPEHGFHVGRALVEYRMKPARTSALVSDVASVRGKV